MNPDSHYAALARWERRVLEPPDERYCEQCCELMGDCWCSPYKDLPDVKDGDAPGSQ